MLSALLVPVLGALSSQATIIAVDAGAKLVAPKNLKAISAFALKLGVGLVGAIIAEKVSGQVKSNVEGIFQTIDPSKTVLAEEDPSTKPKNSASDTI